MEATTAEQIRATVRDAYGAVATQKQQGGYVVLDCCRSLKTDQEVAVLLAEN